MRSEEEEVEKRIGGRDSGEESGIETVGGREEPDLFSSLPPPSQWPPPPPLPPK